MDFQFWFPSCFHSVTSSTNTVEIVFSNIASSLAPSTCVDAFSFQRVLVGCVKWRLFAFLRPITIDYIIIQRANHNAKQPQAAGAKSGKNMREQALRLVGCECGPCYIRLINKMLGSCNIKEFRITELYASFPPPVSSIGWFYLLGANTLSTMELDFQTLR